MTEDRGGREKEGVAAEGSKFRYWNQIRTEKKVGRRISLLNRSRQTYLHGYKDSRAQTQKTQPLPVSTAR